LEVLSFLPSSLQVMLFFLSLALIINLVKMIQNIRGGRKKRALLDGACLLLLSITVYLVLMNVELN